MSHHSAAALPHVPALDGLRGVAVALVVGYHLAPDVIPGGFLGVDVFFVLSGFLITSLLLTEVGRRGRVDLPAFYLRRFRRLAPALLLLLAGLSLYAWRWATPGELGRIREHSLWTLGYLANWKFVFDGTTYTDLVAGQSPLRHTWSLAIEEQFYIVFPALLVLGGRVLRWQPERLRRWVIGASVGGAVASAGLMAVLWADTGDPSRGYFGTDTRAHSLLVGVALGALLLGRPPREGLGARVALWAGTTGMAVLAVAVATGEESAGWLQQGGFLLVALAVAGVISAMERISWLRRGLSVRPLVALGAISYGVYLWHWPIVVLVDPARTGMDGLALAALRVALTLGLALLSFVVVERPVRAGALGRAMPRLAPTAVAGLATALVVGLVVASTVLPGPPAAPPATVLGSYAPGLPALPLPGPDGSVPDVLAGAEPAGADAAPPLSPAPARAGPIRVVVLGDSVAHTLAGGAVGAFPDFTPWGPEQSPYDPASVVLWSVARPACSFLPGGLRSNGVAVDLSRFCGDWRQDLEVSLSQHPTDLMVVALLNDGADRRVDGADVDAGTPAHHALLHSFLDEVRTIADRHDADLALLALPPVVGPFVLPGDEDGRREHHLRAGYLRYAEDQPGVRVLDLFDTICPGGDCDRPPTGFDPAWRYDGQHFTRDGAGWVAAWLTAQLDSDASVVPPGRPPRRPVD